MASTLPLGASRAEEEEEEADDDDDDDEDNCFPSVSRAFSLVVFALFFCCAATSMTGLNQFISTRWQHRRHTGISRKSCVGPKIRAGIMAKSSRWQFLQKLWPSK